MDLAQAIVLGILQGIFEWLPISSQGQVTVAATQLFGIAAEKALDYSIYLHIGTLISAIAYFRHEIAKVLKMQSRKTVSFLLVAVVASAITAIPSFLLLRNFALTSFILTLIVGFGLIASGMLQLKKRARKGQLNVANGTLLGLAQGLAVVPGISRSGITTAALLFEDFTPEQAFRISFLLSIPSIFIAEVLFGLYQKGINFEPNAIAAIAVAATVGFLSMGWLIRIAHKVNFGKFCIAFGLFYLAVALL